MPFTAAVIDSLPYIDNEPTPEERAAAQSLIDVELAEAQPQQTPFDNEQQGLHPLIPPLPAVYFSPCIQAELERVESKKPLNAIDLSRYESSNLPSFDDCDRESLCTALRSVYVSQIYLNNRKKNLEYLETYGKNAWLLGNAQLESILRDMERDLVQKKNEIEICALERKSAQEAIGGEVKSLEESWKRAMGRALETEIAVENLKSRIFQKKVSS
ncbi:Pre-mRNA-splicing factor SPF27-like protein [Erysiphe neolycopersici]|uniref:Pre-mRNA-splicing factor SPF27-like protein n=1 Tax=Erysiphe neolycopersici TaxID=212602 RepID=A0A420HYI3_9PEZI|nr:Pre-mRNA-splicing factor SPF27-like protein [Erysiphe neolycopersici]